MARRFKIALLLAVVLVAFACTPHAEAGHGKPGCATGTGFNRGYRFDPTLPLRTDPYWNYRYQNPWYPYPYPPGSGIYVDPWGRVVDRWGRPLYPGMDDPHRGRVHKHGDLCKGYGHWCDRHKRHHQDRGRCFRR